MSAEQQIDVLANYIMREFPEKIADGGAGDVAIMILKEYKKLTSDNSDYAKCSGCGEIVEKKDVQKHTGLCSVCNPPF
jgi:hypothetical protein